jgi:aspartyl-tRNA(Asn)/glutamyl-tRNA(Gln) amidotransferase subunit A
MKMKTKSNDVLKWSLTELAEAIENRTISPVEVMKLMLQKIAIKDKELNAYISLMEENAIKNAKMAELQIQKGNYLGPLHGVPIAVKDNIFVKGYKNTMASEIFKDFVPDEDAELIRKLKSAGAIIIGKTNMHELTMGLSFDRSYFGPVRNPLILRK